jgi:hypothetical protein
MAKSVGYGTAGEIFCIFPGKDPARNVDTFNASTAS